MESQVVAAFVLAMIGSVVLLLSYLLGVCKEFSLIAGLDTSKVRDREGLAGLCRTWLLSLGIVELLLSLAVVLVPALIVALVVAFAVVHLAGVVGLVLRSQRYLA